MENLASNPLGILIAIPTYNNGNTLARVLDKTLALGYPILLINDGCTDNSANILSSYAQKINLITFPKNKGKGMALRAAFEFALAQNYQHLITLDSDGQHFPEDVSCFVEKIQQSPHSLIMGARKLKEEGAPTKSSFGNKFSNFWYYLETGIKLPDTQTGFRCYPLKYLKNIKLYTSKFELEIEVIVKLAWKGAKVHSVPIKVKYDPEERVSHFRPGVDFFRISVLNTYLVFLTLLWYLPKRLFSKNIFKLIWKEAVKADESNLKKALSIGFGFFFGIVPIWGFQLLIGIPFSIATKLNKVLFVTAAHISIPPMIPLIVVASYKTGQWLLGTPQVVLPKISEITLETIHTNFVIYAWGAIVLAVIIGLVTTLLSWVVLHFTRKK